MEFHDPDIRWQVFGCANYEQYLERYLVRGKFHNRVPKEVTDAYVTIEYLMAHAYYFYPMYDEALSKLLRIMEMAIKLRCKEIGINLVKGVNKNKREIKFTYKEFIDKINVVEPDKRLNSVLNWARDIRNYFMHLDSNFYGGGTFKQSFLTCINTINILFAPKNHFEIFIEKYSSYQDSLVKFSGTPLVLEFDQKRFLVHKVSCIDVFVSQNKERQCLFVEFVLDDFSQENISKMARPAPMIFHIEKLNFTEDQIVGNDVDMNLPLKICKTNHPENINTFNGYLNYLEEIKKKHPFSFEDLNQSQIPTSISKFRYEYYQSLTFQMD